MKWMEQSREGKNSCSNRGRSQLWQGKIWNPHNHLASILFPFRPPSSFFLLSTNMLGQVTYLVQHKAYWSLGCCTCHYYLFHSFLKCNVGIHIEMQSDNTKPCLIQESHFLSPHPHPQEKGMKWPNKLMAHEFKMTTIFYYYLCWFHLY